MIETEALKPTWIRGALIFSNDLDEGFRRTAYPPEYIYVLRFSPQKLDGKFHKLKVTFSGPEKLSMQAREGYYALKPGSDKWVPRVGAVMLNGVP